VVELGPIVTPLRTPKVPTVANGTAKVSVANKAFPLTCRELVGFVVPIPTQAFELMTDIFVPLEKMAMFEPTFPYVPTDKELEMYTFPRT
jgi:hypothetical protein